MINMDTSDKAILVTGAAGFIGSNFCSIARAAGHNVIGVDKADGPPPRLFDRDYINGFHINKCSRMPNFIKADTSEARTLKEIFSSYAIKSVVNFAGQSSVDVCTADPKLAMQNNVTSVYNMLETLRAVRNTQGTIPLFHMSTDEVYGESLDPEDWLNEESLYKPTTPYAATKACGDMLCKSWANTYDMHAVVLHSCNCYGPNQQKDKLIPAVIHNALSGQPIGIEGNGSRFRTWVYVDDLSLGIFQAMDKARSGEDYLFGTDDQLTTLQVANKVCRVLDNMRPRADGKSYTSQIVFKSPRVYDDNGYAIDWTKVRTELSFRPKLVFDVAIEATVKWYIAHYKN